jgi:hypothetical protein
VPGIGRFVLPTRLNAPRWRTRAVMAGRLSFLFGATPLGLGLEVGEDAADALVQGPAAVALEQTGQQALPGLLLQDRGSGSWTPAFHRNTVPGWTGPSTLTDLTSGFHAGHWSMAEITANTAGLDQLP